MLLCYYVKLFLVMCNKNCFNYKNGTILFSLINIQYIYKFAIIERYWMQERKIYNKKYTKNKVCNNTIIIIFYY